MSKGKIHMKNKLLIAVITSATLLSLCSCSKKEETIPTTTKETTSIVQTTKETTTKETTIQETKTTTIPETTTQAQETTTETTIIQGSALFEEVYAPYAKREKSFAFGSVKAFIEESGYKYDIVEPDEDTIGTIKVLDGSGDYVYFSFYLCNNVETIMLVSYHQDSSNSEVSLSNYSDNNSSRYDVLNTHVIGESSVEVKTLDEQRTFLFQ